MYFAKIDKGIKTASALYRLLYLISDIASFWLDVVELSLTAFYGKLNQQWSILCFVGLCTTFIFKVLKSDKGNKIKMNT